MEPLTSCYMPRFSMNMGKTFIMNVCIDDEYGHMTRPHKFVSKTLVLFFSSHFLIYYFLSYLKRVSRTQPKPFRWLSINHVHSICCACFSVWYTTQIKNVNYVRKDQSWLNILFNKKLIPKNI